MKIKNEKGVSLITLTIAIVILIAITSMLVYSSQDSIRLSGVQKLYNDIATLGDKVSSYYLENGELPIGAEYNNNNFIGDISNTNQKNINDGEKYYVLDLSALGGVTLNYGREYSNIESAQDINNLTDLYIINSTTHTIYYPAGVEFEGTRYYTLQENWSEVELAAIPIYTAEQLAKIGTNEKIAIDDKDGAEYIFASDAIYSLQNDIDLSTICQKVDGTTQNDKSWEPIGTEINPFKGKFYGNGYTINNIYINTNKNDQGLFGVSNGVVQDIKEINGTIVAKENVGAICARQGNGQIQNCKSNVNITAEANAGGICGISSSSKIYNCSNIGDVTTTNNKADSTIAGICGTNYEKSEIKYCYNIGEITGKSNYTGGIVGTNYLGIIEECYNTGTLSALEGESIGGIVGYQYADEISNEENAIKNCYNTAGIESQVANAGGICGNAKTGIIENCYNASKNITATGESIGGIVGIGNPNIKNCYSIEGDIALYANINVGTIDRESAQMSEENLKTADFIKRLNTDESNQIWEEDTEKLNNGYPILSWQQK